MNQSFSDLFLFKQDFAQGGPGKVIFVLVVAMIYGLCLRFVYRAYYRDNEPVDGSIGRSFPLIAPAVAMIFWLIQFSLPLSLGLLGALSFVRFRTPIKRAEDIAFIMIMVSGSLACAVGHFGSVISLLVLVAVYGIVRAKFPQIAGAPPQFAVITFNTKKTVNVNELSKGLKEAGAALNLISTSTHDGITSVVFNVPKANAELHEKVTAHLEGVDADARIEIFYPDNQVGGY